MRKPFFSQEKKGFRAFQRKAIMREQKSVTFLFAQKGWVLQRLLLPTLYLF